LEKMRGARVLLAEDNEINQEVAKEILEQAGLVVEIAADGKEAVQKTTQVIGDGNIRFDAVLMDIQMPVMNGFEATGKIREWEKNQTRAPENADRIPIIAMTAHAMAGDKDKSLNAGMDDHVTKPIDPDKLFAALVKWIKPRERKISDLVQSPTEAKPSGGGDDLPADLPGIDVTNGLKRLGGNKKLYRKILVKFYQEYLETVTHIRDALAQKDQELAVRLAHTVKGVAGNIGALELQEVSAKLEFSIKQEKTDALEGLLEDLSQSLNVVLSSLESFSNIKADVQEGLTKEGKPEKLLELVLQLKPYIARKKPKPAKDIMEEISGFQWSENYTQGIADLKRLIGKYRFKEAEDVLSELLNALGK
jgi:two-component system sensor histidine kinase/response regulator